jgi:transcriptional regulator with XRE-family HTH domain
MANDFRFLEFRVDKYGVKRMTQEELAKELKLTRSRIVALEQKPDVIPTREDLQAYCTYFDTTSDYLLGIRDTKTVDENIAMVSRVTGLNEQAIESLRKIKECAEQDATIKDDLNMLNFIMSDFDIFDTFISHIKLYVNSTEYTKPLYYDYLKNCFAEYDTPDIFRDGHTYLSVGNNNGNVLHIEIDKLLEGCAEHCIFTQLEKWRIKYKDERK